MRLGVSLQEGGAYGLDPKALLGAVDAYKDRLARALGVDPAKAAHLYPAACGIWVTWKGRQGPVFPPAELMDGLRDRGVAPMFHCGADPRPGYSAAGFTYDRILAGDCDEGLKAFAAAANAWRDGPGASGKNAQGRTKSGVILFRWNFEMNTHWMPWSPGWRAEAAPFIQGATVEPRTLITANVPHGLKVGDHVQVEWNHAAWNARKNSWMNGNRTVTEVPSPTTFRIDWAVTSVSGGGAGGHVLKGWPGEGTFPGNTLANFKKAWAHVHDRIRVAGGASHVRMFYCPFNTPESAAGHMPDDAVVQVAGCDAYDEEGTGAGMVQAIRPTYDAIQAAAGPKRGARPFLIGEGGSERAGGHPVWNDANDAVRAAWLDGLDVLATWPAFAGYTYFNLHVRGSKDWRFDAVDPEKSGIDTGSPKMLRAWAQKAAAHPGRYPDSGP